MEGFAFVPDRLGAATAAFLAGDRKPAKQLVAADPAIHSLQIVVEDVIQTESAAGGHR